MTVRVVLLLIILMTIETLSTPWYIISQIICRTSKNKTPTEKWKTKTSHWPHFKYKRNNYRLHGISSLACVAFNASVIAHKIRRDPLLCSFFFLNSVFRCIYFHTIEPLGGIHRIVYLYGVHHDYFVIVTLQCFTKPWKILKI